jgi:hypothetical protein
MKNFDKFYLSRFSVDPDSEFTEFENFTDFNSDNETYQFIDDDINELEDLFWNE